MPNAHNLTDLRSMMDSIYDSIWGKDDLSNALIPVLRHNATQLWKTLDTVCLGISWYPKDIARSESSRAMKMVYVMKVVASCGGTRLAYKP